MSNCKKTINAIFFTTGGGYYSNGKNCLKAGALKLMRQKRSDERKVHAGMKRKYKRQIDAFDIYALNLEDGNFTVSQLETLIIFKINGTGYTRFFKTAKRNDLMNRNHTYPTILNVF